MKSIAQWAVFINDSVVKHFEMPISIQVGALN